MNIYSIINYAFSESRLVGKRIYHNYYIKNWFERKRNKKFLKKARSNLRDDFNNKNHLISVRISTYNRAKILTERTIPSVLRQTYQNFEIIIIGDHCTDNTEELVSKFKDERIKFCNLPKRGKYPTNLYDRWLVAGVIPANKGIKLCTGDWIAPLDDDDEFSEDHLEILLNYALKNNYEMVYGVVEMEVEPGKWKHLGLYPLRNGGICHLSVLYHSKLKFFKYDINAWKYGEPDDWNMWRRMKEAGVKIGFINKIIGKHYLEGTQRDLQK